MVFIFLFLTHFTLTGSRFIHLITTDSNVFLFMAEWYSIVYISHNFFIHSSVDGRLGCFHVLAIVNSAAINSGIHVSFPILVSSGYMLRSEIDGSYGGFIPSFLRHLHTVFHRLYQFTCPPKMQECSLFSTPSPAFVVCILFDEPFWPVWGDISL